MPKQDGAPQRPWQPRSNDAAQIEAGPAFQPKFDSEGLIPAIVSDAQTSEILMFAWMNADALQLTLETGVAHFWTRSRGRIWKKGEESGNVLDVKELRTDCDQDVLLLKVNIAGAGVACHTGARSCFYRKIDPPQGTEATAKLVRSDE